MEPRITVITLGVDDLERSLRFYRDGLGKEIDEIISGKANRVDNLLKNAPHTAKSVIRSDWQHGYTREQAVYPLSSLRDNKFWPSVARIDNVYGDKNLICACLPIESYAETVTAS